MITVRRDEFLFNSTENKWNDVIDEFSSRLSEYTLNNVSDIFRANFTTTTSVSSVVSEITLMQAMQKYFQFEFVSLCTIPEIRIMGTSEDWQTLRDKVVRLERIFEGELDAWYSKLQPLLEQFVNASKGNIDHEFWDQIYKGISIKD